MKFKKLFFILLGVNILLLMLLVYGVVRTDNNENLPPWKSISKVDTFNLRSYVQHISNAKLIDSFPYKEFLAYANIDNIQSIKKYLACLDSLFDDKSLNQQILSAALTDSLKNKNVLKYNNYQPDSLIRLMQWVEPFKYYADIDSDNEILFVSIHDYWMDFIANSLARFSKENPKVKYDFKYKYIIAKCAEKRVNVPVKVTSLEKVIYNVVGSHWAHLYEGTWNQTSSLQKFLFFFFVIVTFFCYLITIKSGVKFFKRNKNE